LLSNDEEDKIKSKKNKKKKKKNKKHRNDDEVTETDQITKVTKDLENGLVIDQNKLVDIDDVIIEIIEENKISPSTNITEIKEDEIVKQISNHHNSSKCNLNY
jgi:hypothetical protein